MNDVLAPPVGILGRHRTGLQPGGNTSGTLMLPLRGRLALARL
jgi:hypothetical protein